MKRALPGLPAWTAGLSVKRQRELANLIRAHEASCHRAIYEVGKEVEKSIRAEQPDGWRVDMYNAGHRAACHQLFRLAFPEIAPLPDVGGFTAWAYAGREAKPDANGRLRFEGLP